MIGRAVVIGLGMACAALGLAQTPSPKLLLVQIKAPIVDGKDFNVNCRGYFAQEFDEDGRVDVVSWSLTDPTFRAAIESKTLVNPPENPNFEETIEAAQKLKCEYIFIMHSLRHGDKVVANAELYRARRRLWKGETTLTAIVNDSMQLESTSRSLARTWILQMDQDALKGLTARPKVRTPEPDPGDTRPTVPTPPVNDTVGQSNDAAIEAEYARLTKQGDHTAAIQLLRDAVDAEPLLLSRRTLLISALMSHGDSTAAASEARRAAVLFPDAVDLWRLCARTAIRAGNYPQAIRDLNEAVVRSPKDAETRLLLGEAQLFAGRLEFALEHFDAAIKLQPSAEARAFRAATYFSLGRLTLANDELTIATQAMSATTDAERGLIRSAAISYLVQEGRRRANGLKLLIQAVRLNAKDPNHPKTCAAQTTAINGIVRWGSVMGAAQGSEKAFDSAVLALNLLIQAHSEVSAFLATQSDDSISDATITLGEAMKALEAAGQ